MKPCAMSPSGTCPQEAVTTVRLDRLGDRSMCRTHADFIVAQGFGRELEPNAFQPRWVGNLRAVDQTGRMLAR